MDSALPTTPIEHTHPELDENDPNTVIYYKKVNVPLEYPPTPMKEQLNQPKVYPPMMTLSKDYSPATMNASQHSPPHSSSNPAPFSPTSSPINIPQRRPSRTSSLERAGSMPTMSSSSHSSAPHLPSPPTSPWKTSESKLTRSATMIVDETPYPNLPTDVRAWTSAHVAEYLGYSLRFYPRAITEDLGRYVRQSACLNGAQFIDLEEEDLGRMEINLKWRAMIMKAVGILRRETVRASRMELMHWEEGFDPEKDTVSSAASSYQDSTPSLSRASSIRRRSSVATVIAESSVATIPEETLETAATTHTTVMPSNDVSVTDKKTELDVTELRQGIVSDLKEILLVWKREQEESMKKAATAAEASRSSLGFMEGVVIGGVLVAFLLRFSR
ncbi:hypothetical protein BG006_008272 [Podila minutissima]|uniref:SAM domain-containing protein n=1 Tax=Podila minutissima TaxID=64525 RepID=A0A9P5VKA3_9FUNG|nr:hypothetical protein BG006_008272 [Podila minutissima]